MRLKFELKINIHIKGVDELNSLLSVDGIKTLKLTYFRNLDTYAKDDTELELLGKFMEAAKDVIFCCLTISYLIVMN